MIWNDLSEYLCRILQTRPASSIHLLKCWNRFCTLLTWWRRWKYPRKLIQYYSSLVSCPLLRLMYGEYWFRLSRFSMMVIGSFASYTKTKSVESAVWCLLTLDGDVETGSGSELFFSLFWTTTKQAKFNENENKINNRTTNKINERLITNNDWRMNAQQITNNE